MRYSVGVDLGGTNIVAGVVDEEGKILYKKSSKTQGELPFATVVAHIGELISAVILESGIDKGEITSVGLGTPSCINPKTGLLVHANNMNWRNVPLYSELKKHVDYPLFIRNDADCAALGEVFAGAARDCDNALMITLGTGVGGGVILDKKIFNGCDHMGAELGHTKLVYNGAMCTCGQRGCFEAYASATALIRQTKVAASANPQSEIIRLCEGKAEKITGRTAFDAARIKDKTGMDVVDQYISYLAAGLSSLICVFRPEIIVIGGGIGNEGDFLLKPLNRKLILGTYAGDVIGVPPVVEATLGNDAGVIGAALLGKTL